MGIAAVTQSSVQHHLDRKIFSRLSDNQILNNFTKLLVQLNATHVKCALYDQLSVSQKICECAI